MSSFSEGIGGLGVEGRGVALLKSQAWPEMRGNFTVNWREHLEPGILALQLMVGKPAYRQQQARNESLSCTSGNHVDGLPNPCAFFLATGFPLEPLSSIRNLSTYTSPPVFAIIKDNTKTKAKN